MRLLSLGHLRSLWLTDTVGRLVLVGTVALVPLVGGTALALPPRTADELTPKLRSSDKRSCRCESGG
jgi:hypothetical protein